MQFFQNIFVAVSVLASIVSAGTVTFVNQDSKDREIIFTASAGMESIPPLDVPGDKTAMATFPEGWTGNFFSIMKGAESIPGMLGEFSFNGYAGNTFFDVSAIVAPLDNNGIKEIFPKNSNKPMSGCQTFPCNNAYNKWDDAQTMSSTESDFICLIGTLEVTSRRLARGLPAENQAGVAPLTDEVLKQFEDLKHDDVLEQ